MYNNAVSTLKLKTSFVYEDDVETFFRAPFIAHFSTNCFVRHLGFFVAVAISRCLSTTPHPITRARCRILLVLYSLIVRLATHRFVIYVMVVRYNHRHFSL